MADVSGAPSKPIPPSDQTWLHMDRPNNLMHVRSLMSFDGEPDLDSVRSVLRERLIDRYPVFSRRAVQRGGAWYWEDDDDFDLTRHVSEVRLDGDERDLRQWMGDRFSEPLDSDLPLWDVTLVSGIEGHGSVLFSRFHHALADGVRLTQLLFSLCDPIDGVPQTASVGREPAAGGLLSTGAKAVRQGLGDLVDVSVGAMLWPVRAAGSLGSSLRAGLGFVRHPRRLVTAVEGIASDDNASVNTAAELSRLLATPPNTGAAWSGVPGVAKRVAWADGLDLDRIKEIGREDDATVNDVLMGLVARGVERYLTERGTPQREIAWLVPVSLLPFDDNLPEELGNHFALVFLPMPLRNADLRAAIATMQERMSRVKNSVQPSITFGLQWMIAQTPQAIAYRLTNYFANKTAGLLTNVPGPRQAMTFAGVPVAGVLGWVPTSGNQSVGLCIFSYDGQVSIGISGDAVLVPDPERIAELIVEELAAHR